MPGSGPVAWILFAVLAVFVVFLISKTAGALRTRRKSTPEGRKAVAEAKKSARLAKGKPQEKAAHWREASELALRELERPSLAASYALRAVRADRDDVLAIELLSQSLKEAGRLKALERFMWRRLQKPPGPGFERAYDELVTLYDGPLKNRARAGALRALRGRVSAAPPA